MNQSNKALRGVEEMLTSLCEDCDGKGYNEYGGMAMEDDLRHQEPCDNILHDPKTAKSLLALVTNHIKGLDCMQMEEGETVQAPCPDGREGCLVYHTEFRMTPDTRKRNELRSQILKEMGE